MKFIRRISDQSAPLVQSSLKGIFILWCVLFFFADADGGNFVDYRFDNWATDDGLPQNSVLAVRQTRDGYLWFTTFDGLVRFDGVHFTVFDKSNKPAVAGNRFKSLLEDRGQRRPAAATAPTSAFSKMFDD